MADIKLNKIFKRYDKHDVFSDLSLTVEHGECFTLLGPSGCGKTVLMRLLAGFENQQSGTIHIDDTLVADPASGVNVSPDKRDLGVVFQDYAVWPHMSVFDNVGYPLKLARVQSGELRARVMETVEMVGLGGLEKRMPSQLSGGQQQRVALARALVAKPSLMLLDEPLCNLDANLREEMRFEIKALQKNLGITIFYVTHDQEIALAISDRLAIMDEKGRIRQIGSPSEVFEKPVDDFVFRFMGMSNFIPVHHENGAMLVNGGSQKIPFVCPKNASAIKVAACRPSDIKLSRASSPLSSSPEPLRGVIKRASFLGSMIDYLIDVDGAPMRTAIETHVALAGDLMFKEGEKCALSFWDIHWFENLAEESK